MIEPHDQLDKSLDDALRTYCEPPQNEGLEERIGAGRREHPPHTSDKDLHSCNRCSAGCSDGWFVLVRNSEIPN